MNAVTASLLVQRIWFNAHTQCQMIVSVARIDGHFSNGFDAFPQIVCRDLMQMESSAWGFTHAPTQSMGLADATVVQGELSQRAVPG